MLFAIIVATSGRFSIAIWTVHALRGVLNFVVSSRCCRHRSRTCWENLSSRRYSPLLRSRWRSTGLRPSDEFTALRARAVSLGSPPSKSPLPLCRLCSMWRSPILPTTSWGFVASMVVVSVVRTARELSRLRLIRVRAPAQPRTRPSTSGPSSRPIFLSSIVTLILGQTDKLILAAKLRHSGSLASTAIAATHRRRPTSFRLQLREQGLLRSSGRSAERCFDGRSAARFLSSLLGFQTLSRRRRGPDRCGPATHQDSVRSALLRSREVSRGILSIASVMLAVTQCAANFFVVEGTPRDVPEHEHLTTGKWLACLAPAAFWLTGTLGLSS